MNARGLKGSERHQKETKTEPHQQKNQTEPIVGETTPSEKCNVHRLFVKTWPK
jgi:hypothetical protein